MTDTKEHRSYEKPDEHKAGVAVGAVSGTAMGALAGASVGPVGALAGAAVGGILGSVAGRSAAKSVDAAVESRHWEQNFKTRPYVDPALKYEDYEPAFRFGWESVARHDGRDFNDIDVELMREWDAHRGESPLTWERAREASRDAWDRIHRGEGTAAAHAPNSKRKAYETNSTMDRGDG